WSGGQRGRHGLDSARFPGSVRFQKECILHSKMIWMLLDDLKMVKVTVQFQVGRVAVGDWKVHILFTLTMDMNFAALHKGVAIALAANNSLSADAQTHAAEDNGQEKECP